MKLATFEPVLAISEVVTVWHKANALRESTDKLMEFLAVKMLLFDAKDHSTPRRQAAASWLHVRTDPTNTRSSPLST